MHGFLALERCCEGVALGLSQGLVRRDLVAETGEKMLIPGVLLDCLGDAPQHASADEGPVHGHGFVLIADQLPMDDTHAADDVCDFAGGLQLVWVKSLSRPDLGVQLASSFFVSGLVQSVHDDLGNGCDLLVAHEGSGHSSLE